MLQWIYFPFSITVELLTEIDVIALYYTCTQLHITYERYFWHIWYYRDKYSEIHKTLVIVFEILNYLYSLRHQSFSSQEYTPNGIAFITVTYFCAWYNIRCHSSRVARAFTTISLSTFWIVYWLRKEERCVRTVCKVMFQGLPPVTWDSHITRRTPMFLFLLFNCLLTSILDVPFSEEIKEISYSDTDGKV